MTTRVLNRALIVLLLATPAAIGAPFGDWPNIFDPLQLRVLHLEMEPGDWSTVQNDESLSIKVPAWFHAEGEAPILVSVRRKSGDPLGAGQGYKKVSLKIDINDFVTGQGWHGLKKLSLENGDDEDVVTEGIAWQLERLASGTQGYGYPVGHAAWVVLFINGVNTGVYVNVEQVDKRFLENRLDHIPGQTWLYKVSDIGGRDLKDGGPQDSPTVEALCYLPFEPDALCLPPADLATQLPQYVDMQGLLTEMASDTLQANRDALLSKGKNFYFADYLGGAPRKYFPWDRDSSLSGQGSTAPIYAGNSDYGAILSVPEFRAQYSKILNDLVCGPWSIESIQSVLDAVEPVVSAALAADPNRKFDDVAGRFDSLAAWLAQRVSSVTAQIEGFQPCPTVQVTLNEVMATNLVFLEDPDEPLEFPDWFELHNPMDTTADLGGLYLTDDLAQPTQYQIPAGVVIPPGGHVIFYADEDPEQGPHHTNFRLAATGEVLAVYDRNGVTQIDAIAFGPQFVDVAYARFPDGNGGWGFATSPTPAAVNGPHNGPPAITEVAHIPTSPELLDAVVVTARVQDDDGVTGVTLSYDVGDGLVTTPMRDDGTAGDGVAGDDIYGAVIPAQPTDTVVRYHVESTDTLGARQLDPPTAPAGAYVYVVGYQPPALFINELMADNDAVIEDPDEPLAYEDWFELYNATAETLDLGGMYLTDELAFPTKYRIPDGTLIAGGDHLLFWADGEPFQGPLHLPFRLGAGGEQIGLFDRDARGNIAVDTVTFGAQLTNVSEGRCPDGSVTWQLFDAATPAAPNEPCAAGPEACCLPAGQCQEIDAGRCASLGGVPQGAGSTCATAACPECLVDEDCDDGVFCTLETCDPIARTCDSNPFDTICQDGSFCNGPERCDTVAGCSAGATPCDAAACDETNDVCSGAAAGRLADGIVGGTMLRLSKADGALGLTWGTSCLATDDDYAIYEGVLGAYYSHGLAVCSTGGVPQIEITAGNGSRYYLVVPRNATNEGSLGRTSDGFERPQGSPACTSQSVAACP